MPSRSIHVVANGNILFFFWLNNIPLHMYLYILQFLYPFCWWTLRLLPCLSYCKECCSEHASAATAAKSLQSCPALCDSIDRSPPGSPVPGILQARTLEWVAISFSNAWKWKVKGKSLSCLTLSDPMDYSPPGSSIRGILQARVLEWGAISFSRRSSPPRDLTQVSIIVDRRFTIWAVREVWQWNGIHKSFRVSVFIFFR